MFAQILRHILSPDWVSAIQDISHPLWTLDYLTKTLSGLTVAIIIAAYVELRLRWYRRNSAYRGELEGEGTVRNDPTHMIIYPNVGIISHKNAPKLIVNLDLG